jgi:uncharacterized membrane protein
MLIFVVINTTFMHEKNYRSLIKSISYRITGTIATFIISFVITGELKLAFSITGVEAISKIIIFYLHERMWNKIKFGKVPPSSGPEYEI